MAIFYTTYQIVVSETYSQKKERFSDSVLSSYKEVAFSLMVMYCWVGDAVVTIVQQIPSTLH
jgi:hypothetical protein